ncbi:hypothetical protein GCM10010495_79810 [Kitasatospora herbaricolor]|uniref:DUF6896 domain-containing protein n=1 Tax=Kitasatospora herbaricolor TaxID=68217 RepID=UPI0019C847F1|nr:hypothetical protein GCM10010495_79810 [Kitasatospora herbaricolor]
MTSDASGEVKGYLEALARLRAAFAEGCPDLGSSLALVAKRARARELAKSGELSGGIEYSVHGSGCLFTDPSGYEIDVDFLGDGTEVFDSWRIRRFSLSRGIEFPAGQDELTRECRRMVMIGVLGEPVEGWFSFGNDNQ